MSTMMFKLRSNKGFTLIEMLITLALVAVVSVPIAAALILGLRIYDSEVQADTAFSNQQDVLLMIKNQVRANPSEVAIVDTDNGSQALEIGKDAETIRYYLDGSALYRLSNSTVTLVLDDVAQFTLTNQQKNSSGKLRSFRLALTSSINGREQVLLADIALDRY